METQEKAVLESIVSMVLALHATLNKTTVDKGDKEKRSHFRDRIVTMLSDYRPDPHGWEAMKHVLPYDDYLVGRKVDGSLTSFDLVRPGLAKNQFSSEYAYYEHMHRVTGEKKGTETGEPTALKRCSKCNEEKPATKFKHRGGAVCNSCRGKIYRSNKALGSAS